MKKTISFLIIFVMIFSSLALVNVIPVASAAPSSSQSNTATFTYNSESYYTKTGSLASGSGTINAVEAGSQQTVLINQGGWSSSGTTGMQDIKSSFSWTIGSFQYWSGSTVTLNQMFFDLGYYYASTVNGPVYNYGIGSLYLNLTVDGQIRAWSHTYNYNYGPSSSQTIQVVADPSWNPSLSSGDYSVSLSVVATGMYATPSSNLQSTTSFGGLNEIQSLSPVNNVAIPIMYGWTYSGQSYTGSWTNPSGLHQYAFSYSGPSISSSLSSGTHTGTSLPSSSKFTVSGDPNTPSESVSWSVTNAIVKHTTTPSAVTSAGTITQNGNWFNTSSAYSFSSLNDPSGAISSSTWPTIISYTVSNLLESGYGATYNNFMVNGASKDTSTNTQYYSYSGSLTNTFSLTVNTQDLINYNPTVTTPTVTFTSGSTAQVSFTTSEQINQKESVVINWGDGHTTSLNNHASGTYTQSHTYSSSYSGSFSQSESPYVTVTNIPNALSSYNSALTTTSSQASYSFGITTIPTTPNTVLHKGNEVWMNVTTNHLTVTRESATVDGSPVSVTQSSVDHYYVSSASFGLTSVIVDWTLTAGSVTNSQSIQYASPLFPTKGSTSVTYQTSDSTMKTYPITLSGVPHGVSYPITITTDNPNASLTYQQEFTLNPATYGINSQGSNFYVEFSNGTKAYTWVQSVNSTSITFWSKIYSDVNQTLYLDVGLNSANYFSANGYVGEAPQLSAVYGEYFNAKEVFGMKNASDFVDSSGYTINNIGIKISDGLFMPFNLSAQNGFAENSWYSNASYWSGSILSYAHIVGTNTTNPWGGYGANIPIAGDKWEISIGESGSNDLAIISRNATNVGNDSITLQSLVDFTSNFTEKIPLWTSSGQVTVYYGTQEFADTLPPPPGSVYPWRVSGWNANGANYTIYYAIVANGNTSLAMPSSSISSSGTDFQPNGSYQQLITISNPSAKGINSAGSNFDIAASNGTPLYTWIQSINSTSITAWVKVPYSSTGSETLSLNVMPSFENLLSSTGYLGEASYINPNNDNFQKVGVHEWVIDYGGPYSVLPSSTSFITYSSSGATSGNGTYNNNYLHSQANASYGGVTQTNYYYSGFNSYFFGPYLTLPAGSFITDYAMQGFTQYNPTNATELRLSIGVHDNNGQENTSWAYYKAYLYVYDGNKLTLGSYAGDTVSHSAGQYKQGVWYHFPFSWAYNVSSITEFYGDHLNVGAGAENFYNFTLNTENVYQTSIIPMENMPSFSIGTGTTNAANSSNILYWGYDTFRNDPSNLSAGQYTYKIPDSFNKDYMTVYYPLSWSFDYASWTNYVQGTIGGQGNYITFLNITNITTVGVTFNEPITIGRPLGTLSIGAEPTVAFDGNGFFNLPSGLIHWKANGIPVNPSGLSVVVGKQVNLTAYGFGNIPLEISQDGHVFDNYTLYTPTLYISYLPVYVNITSIQLTNLNSTDEVQVVAKNLQGIQQDQVLLSPYGSGASSATIYLPSGSYSFYYTELNYTTGSVINNAISTSTQNINGMYWVMISGFTIFQLGNQLTFTNTSIQNAIQTLSVIISLNDSAIKNLTLGVELNLSATNSSIQNVLTTILVNQTFMQDSINNVNTSLQSRFDTTNSIITMFQSNITVLDTYVNNTVNTINNLTVKVNTNLTTANSIIQEIKLIEQTNFTSLNSTIKNNFLKVLSNQNFFNTTIGNLNLSIQARLKFYYSQVDLAIYNVSVKQKYTDTLVNTSAYRLILGSPHVYGSKYVYPVYVVQENSSLPASLNVSRQAASNLNVTYLEQGAVNEKHSISNLTVGFFDLILNITSLQKQQIKNGSFFALTSPFTQGSIANVASGEIKASNLPAATLTWYEKYLGFKSLPPGSAWGDFTWLLLSLPGVMSAGILGAVIALYYLRKFYVDIRYERDRNAKEEEREEREARMSRDISDMKKAIEKMGGKSAKGA